MFIIGSTKPVQSENFMEQVRIEDVAADKSAVMAEVLDIGPVVLAVAMQVIHVLQEVVVL